MWVFSTVCLIGGTYEVIQAFRKSGFESIFCDEKRDYNKGKIVFWLYLYYLSKYYELLDTFIIVFRRAPLRFIHTYHHVTTMTIAYLGIYLCGTGHWIPILVNTFVHVIMYYYYIVSTLGYRVWWKNQLTNIQLVQFIIDFVCFVSWSIYDVYFVQPRGITCAGSGILKIFGLPWNTVLCAFIVLTFFILFYR